MDPNVSAEAGRTTPLTPEQEELWLSIQFYGEPANLAYNRALSLRLEGDLDVARLRGALDALVARHEALRTTLSEDHRTLRIAPKGRLVLHERDLSGQSLSEREQSLTTELETATRTPFDLVHGPLVRARLLCLERAAHVLVLSAHHIVQDGWSRTLFLDELGKLYTALRRGLLIDLPPAAAYGDYALSRAEEAGSEAAARDLSFWRSRFPKAPPPLDLPLDRRRPTERRFESDRISLPLRDELVARLQEIATVLEIPLATLLLGAFQVFVARVTGRDGVTVAIPLSGQSIVNQPTLMGHCVRTLPLYTTVDLEAPFVDHLRKLHGALTEALEHPRATFGAVARALSLPRDPSRVPLTPISFEVERSLRPEFDELSVSLEGLSRRWEVFELAVSVELTGSSALLHAQFNTGLFERSGVEQRLREYVALLGDVAADARRPAGDLEILTESARETLRAVTTAARTEPPTETLCALFRDAAVKSPGTTAVSAGGKTLSYAELDQGSAALAQELVSRGIGPGSLVGVLTSRSVELPVALLGVLRSGAACVPLEPGAPRKLLEFMIEDAHIRAVVAEATLARLVPGAARLFVVDAPREEATTDLDNSRLEDPAYLVYSRGSSGPLRGVIVEHRNATNLLLAMTRTPGFGPSDVLLAVSGVSRDAAVPELFLPLVSGGKVVIAAQDDLEDVKRLIGLLESSKATFMQATPALWRRMIDAGLSGDSRLTALVGGDVLDRELATKLLSRFERVFTLYGHPETSVWSTLERLCDDSVNIGRPIENTSAYVLDGRRRRVPEGVTGELYLGGSGVGRGYFERAELTSDRFLPDPFASSPGARMFKTGDLARVTRDGKLEWLGPADEARLDGQPVELERIAAGLAACSGVREAVAVLREHTRGDGRIVAYVCPAPGSAASESELRTELRKRLPLHMIPHDFVLLETLPLTPSGKIDRQALPLPESSKLAEYRAPESDVEREIAGVIAELLSVERVGLDDDFFELGGHSLSALRLCARVREARGINLPLRVVFANPTLKKIADFVEAALLLQRESGVRVAAPEREEVLL